EPRPAQDLLDPDHGIPAGTAHHVRAPLLVWESLMRRAIVAAVGGMLVMAGTGSLAGQDSQFGIAGLGAPGMFSSVRAWSTGGAFAPFDGLSSLTDAALSDISRLSASATSINDYRRVNDGTNASSLRGSRFPMLQVAGPVFGKLVVGGGFSTYLYRSY